MHSGPPALPSDGEAREEVLLVDDAELLDDES